jgi:hypothetical protein
LTQKETEIRRDKGSAATIDEGKSLDERIAKMNSEMASVRAQLASARQKLKGTQDAISEIQKFPVADSPTGKETIPDIKVQEFYDPKSGDPEPDWHRKKQVTFVCRRGRVFRLNFGPRVDAAVDKALGFTVTEKTSLTREHLEKIAAYFEKHDIGDENVRVKYELKTSRRFQGGGVVQRTYISTNIQFRGDSVGEDAPTILGGKSKAQTVLGKDLSPSRNWVRFLVWADSFDTYQAARDLAANKLGYQVGWLPFDVDEPFPGGGGGGGGPEVGPG